MRYLLLILLVVVFPGAVYWAVNGMADPVDTLDRFTGQLGDIRRSQPDPVEEDVLEPPPEDEPKQEPEIRETPVEQPRPEIRIPVVSRREADALFVEGRFDEAATAYGDSRTRRRALAQLGVAFAQAFPPPTGEYLVVELRGGKSTMEGFNIGNDLELKLLDPTGRSIGLSAGMVATKRTISPDKVIQRTRPRIEIEAQSDDPRRLFRAAAAAFRIGRPDLAAPLLERLVKADQQTMLKAISKDVAPTAQVALFRAYSDAVIVPEDRPDPVETVARPKTNGTNTTRKKNGSGALKLDGSKRKRRNGKLTINDKQARKFMVEARPHRIEGKRLYEKIYADGLDNARPEDVDEAIRSYEKALALYEKALLREDTDPIFVLVQGCSKKLFQLRFWKEQVGSK